MATARAIMAAHETMATEWAEWVGDRSSSRAIPRELVERQFRLVIHTLVEMLGPLKREARLVWQRVLEHYGRTAAARGLAAGEVVEELQQLRVLLLRHIGASVAEMRPRRAVAVFLRLNDIVDRGVAAAVVGYTDALVASLMLIDRDTQLLTQVDSEDLVRQLSDLEKALQPLAHRAT